jgi:hypothetical protein
MEKQIILHGGIPLNLDDEEPVFINDEDDELGFEEEDELQELVQRIMKA